METTSTAPRIAPIYWIASPLFILLFTAFFPVMIGVGLRSPIFWTVFVALWVCAAIHGRLTKEQLAIMRRELRPVIGACIIVSVVVFARCAIRLLDGDSPETRVWEIHNLLPGSFLASCCAIGALSSSYKKNPS